MRLYSPADTLIAAAAAAAVIDSTGYFYSERAGFLRAPCGCDRS